MTTNIRTWGNSQGIYIPKSALKQAGLEVNDPVEISVEGDTIMIKKDQTLMKKKEALENLRELRKTIANNQVSTGRDYKKELEEYFDEKYGL